MNLRSLPLSVVLVFPFAGLADEGVYRWTDANGEEHYTNDVSTLPGDTVVTPVAGEDVSVVRHERPGRTVAAAEPTKDQLEYEKLKHEVARARIETERAAQALKRGELEAENYWRGSFRRMRTSLRALQNALEREKAYFVVGDGLTVSHSFRAIGVNCHLSTVPCPLVENTEEIKVRIRQLEREVKLMEDDLAELERRASFESVPQEWRR